MARGVSYFHSAKDCHEVAAIGGRFYADDIEADIETGYIMGWTVNNITG